MRNSMPKLQKVTNVLVERCGCNHTYILIGPTYLHIHIMVNLGNNTFFFLISVFEREKNSAPTYRVSRCPCGQTKTCHPPSPPPHDTRGSNWNRPETCHEWWADYPTRHPSPRWHRHRNDSLWWTIFTKCSERYSPTVPLHIRSDQFLRRELLSFLKQILKTRSSNEIAGNLRLCDVIFRQDQASRLVQPEREVRVGRREVAEEREGGV